MSELVLSYEPDSSGYGSIRARVEAERFSGKTGFAVTPESLTPFIEALSAYPMHAGANLIVGAEFEDGPLIQIEIRPSDPLGGLKVGVRLADDRDRSRYVSTSFEVVYSDVEAFRLALRKALTAGGEARLSANTRP